MTKTIPGTHGTTVIRDTFGISVGGVPHVEHDHAQERADDRIESKAVAKLLGIAAQDLDVARAYGFPGPIGHRLGEDSSTPIYSRRQVTAWRDNLKAFVGRLK